MHTHVHMHTQTCRHTHAHESARTHTHARTHRQTRRHTNAHTHMHKHTFTYKHTHIHADTHMCTHTPHTHKHAPTHRHAQTLLRQKHTSTQAHKHTRLTNIQPHTLSHIWTEQNARAHTTATMKQLLGSDDNHICKPMRAYLRAVTTCHTLTGFFCAEMWRGYSEGGPTPRAPHTSQLCYLNRRRRFLQRRICCLFVCDSSLLPYPLYFGLYFFM